MILITRRSELSAVLALLAYPFLVGTFLLRQGGSLDQAFLVGTGMAVVAAFWGIWHLVSGLALSGLWSIGLVKKESVL